LLPPFYRSAAADFQFDALQNFFYRFGLKPHRMAAKIADFRNAQLARLADPDPERVEAGPNSCEGT
jgi:hypothetical protein